MTASDREQYERARALLDQDRLAEAFALYEKLANAGDPNCQTFAGWMCYEGLGTAQNKERALEWFKKAAALGSAAGEFYCGRYAVTVKRYDEAMDWFRRAAGKEYGPALFWLGLAHIRGLGVPVDRAKGATLLSRAAAAGHIFAKRELALMQIRGYFGIAQVPIGLVLLPFWIAVGIGRGVRKGMSPELMA